VGLAVGLAVVLSVVLSVVAAAAHAGAPVLPLPSASLVYMIDGAAARGCLAFQVDSGVDSEHEPGVRPSSSSVARVRHLLSKPRPVKE
jgi:hypothetical protein